MRLKLLSFIFLVSITHKSCASGIDADVEFFSDNLDERFKREAEKQLESTNIVVNNNGTKTKLEPYYFEIKDGNDTVARMNLTKGAFRVDLVKTKKKNDLGIIKLEKSQVANYTFNAANPKITAKKTVTVNDPTNPKALNSTKIDVTFTYDETSVNYKAPNDSSTKFEVETAELMFTIEWGSPKTLTRADYWNMTSATLTLKGKVNGTEKTFDSLNLTPKFSYSGAPSDSACGTGYGVCAPIGLCWSCNEQVLKPNDLTKIGEEQLTLQWVMPGMLLEPDWTGKNLNISTFRYSANWDCDPLIPLSVWVSLLVTLLLASILIWAINMLTALQTPNKWDDPKKPGIHVAQTE